ncbi:hypothetical protein LWI29_007946 [Acer saccharum]|uniref:Bidirectional sugar transporter SWEET n=1 Tax=Acer saccharum TaxID=4024 RepID=A0AA39RPH0_ACESA|nr:hypothetical protein LWI29_007946 [Acer saccharum]
MSVGENPAEATKEETPISERIRRRRRRPILQTQRVTFKRIISSKSTEQFSGIPYVMTLLNNLLTTWYGLPFVSENNILVSTINGTGAVIESIYVLIFIIYATKKVKAKIFGLLMFVLSVFAVVALVSLLALHGNTRKIFCGFAAAIFSTIMYASPLSVVMMVIKTKSVEFMPFFLSLFVFLCGSSWFIFGLLGPKWTWVWDGNSAVDILLHLPQQVAAPVGVCYGHLANNLPPPADVINFLQSNGISNVRIFNLDPSTLQSFSGSGIKLMISVPNEILPYLATGNHTLSLQCIDSIANQTYQF